MIKTEAVSESGERQEESFWQGVKDCIPTLLGYLSIGVAAGVVQKTAGLSLSEIALLSLLLYAGSTQFIFAGMAAAGSASGAIIFTVFLVNLRHLLLSAALSPYFRHLTPLRNMWVGSLLTDETFGVAINRAAMRSRLSERWMHGLNVTAYLNWLAANMAGALMAQWIANPEQYGLEFALPAMFIGLMVVAIIAGRRIKLDLCIALLSAVAAVGCSFFMSESMAIIVATVAAATAGLAVSGKWK